MRSLNTLCGIGTRKICFFYHIYNNATNNNDQSTKLIQTIFLTNSSKFKILNLNF